MARGDQRRPKNRKGAASSRRSTPQGLPASGAAPIALSKDEELAQRLMTRDGLRLAMANLIRRIRAGGTRDDVSAMIAERHGYEWFAEQLAEQRKEDRLSDLEAALAEVKAAIAGKQGSALRADAAVVPPFVEEGTDQLRPDMAPAPSGTRGGEPLKS
jgi:hypothetical protein